MNIYIRNKGLITGNIRNRGNNEWSKRSSCSIHQGTKVSLTEECNQVTLTPHRVRPDFNNTLLKQSWSPINPNKAQYLQQVSDTLPKAELACSQP